MFPQQRAVPPMIHHPPAAVSGNRLGVQPTALRPPVPMHVRHGAAGGPVRTKSSPPSTRSEPISSVSTAGDYDSRGTSDIDLVSNVGGRGDVAAHRRHYSPPRWVSPDIVVPHIPPMRAAHGAEPPTARTLRVHPAPPPPQHAPKPPTAPPPKHRRPLPRCLSEVHQLVADFGRRISDLRRHVRAVDDDFAELLEQLEGNLVKIAAGR
jgi:hypothetical protein